MSVKTGPKTSQDDRVDELAIFLLNHIKVADCKKKIAASLFRQNRAVLTPRQMNGIECRNKCGKDQHNTIRF